MQRTAPERILLSCLNNLGDCILFLPVAVALRERYPAARMVLLTSRVGAEAAELAGVFDDFIVPRGCPRDRKARYRLWVLSLAGEVRRGRYDLAVMASGESSFISALLFLGGAEMRVGFDDCKLRWLLTHRVVARYHENEARRNVRLLGALGLPQAIRRPPCHVPADAEREAARRLRAAGVPGREGLPRVLVHPGSAWVNRRWPPELHAELCRRLASDGIAQPVLLEGPAETGLAAGIAGAAGGLPVLAGLEHVGLLAAVMKEMDLFVGHSTGTLHVAALVGLRSVSLWGVSDPVVWGPAWDADRHLLVVAPARPGASEEAVERDRIHACMRSISVESVLAAIRRQLAKERSA